MSLSCAGLDLSYVHGFTCKDIVSLTMWLAPVPYFPNTIIFFKQTRSKLLLFLFSHRPSYFYSRKLAPARAAYTVLFSVPLDKWGLHIGISTTRSNTPCRRGGGVLQRRAALLWMPASDGFAVSLLCEPPSESEALFRKKYCLIQILGEKYLN